MNAHKVVEHLDRGPLTKDEMAALVARDIPHGSVVNLGIGQPTLVADHLPEDCGVVLHTENGMLNMGPAAVGDDIDPDLTNAGKQPVTALPGPSFFHRADSFAMMRSGHLDVCVLGAFQVSVTGDLATWNTGARRDPRRRWGDGPGHRSQAGLRDDDALHQGGHTQAASHLHPPPHRRRLSHSRLHRARCVDVGPDGARVIETFGTTRSALEARLGDLSSRTAAKPGQPVGYWLARGQSV